LLRIRPNLRQHWIGLAVAYHLNGNLRDAKKIMDHYERTIKVRINLSHGCCLSFIVAQNVPDYDVDHSECMLYYVRLVEDLGEISEALGLLDSYAKTRVIVDRTAIMEFRGKTLMIRILCIVPSLYPARLLSKLGSKEAEHSWRALIEQNPDCYDYYRGFFSNRGFNLGMTVTLACIKDIPDIIHVLFRLTQRRGPS
jgi:N-alpha-acetyltransferase 15/16, NatA auxiliary subunit